MLAFLFWDSYRNHLIPCDTAQSAEWICLLKDLPLPTVRSILKQAGL
ncbi:MAG: hypothetical protein RJA09_2585 [Pseudomonadota bacterium]